MAVSDVEPFQEAPTPATLRSPHILSSFQPEPLLAITPEKCTDHPDGTAEVDNAALVCGDSTSKCRQRERFAPATTSPTPV